MLLSSFSVALMPFGTSIIPCTARLFQNDCKASSFPAPLPADINTAVGIPSRA
ncbi:hypothetical protein [Myroides odoratimimus]|uniref:hypothetical protein n=1 Tax=Myroides odoratimimus TaxID=76832 RepID=UPI00217FDE4F|nr:hypothetical protein [Myroides odoratimimus]